MLLAKLKAEFEASSEMPERVLLLEAIGYGGLPRIRTFVRSFARSKAPELRRAAAKGLRHDDTPKGSALLLKLLVDPDPEVQSVAVESLFWRSFNARHQRALHAAIVSDRVRPPDDGGLVFLITKHLEGEARTQALEHLLARHGDDGRVRRLLDEALAR